MKSRSALLFCAVLMPGTLALAQTEDKFKFAATQLRPLERAVLDLHSVAKPQEAAQIREALTVFGYPDKSLLALDRRASKTRPVTRGAERQIEHIEKTLLKTIADLAVRLPSCPDEERRRELARAVLTIDGSCDLAHLTLGHIRHQGLWITAEEHALLPRKTEIQIALQAARKLSPIITVAESKHPLLLLAHGDGHGGHALTSNGLTIHTCWPLARAQRLLADLLRAVAFSRFLVHGGPVALPQDIRHTSVLFTGKDIYEKILRSDLEKGLTNTTWEDSSTRASYYRQDGSLVNNRTTEAHALGGIFSHVTGIVGDRLHGHEEQPTLIVGHGNWVLMALAGAHLPSISFTVTEGSPRGPNTSARESDEVQKMLQGAGLMGARSWLRHEVLAGRDPAWSRSFLPQVGMIDGVDMLKTTFVVEYLHMRGPLLPVLESTRGSIGKNILEVIDSLENSIGVALHEFEEQWRSWMRGLVAADCVIDRLRGINNGYSEQDTAVLQYLHGVRSAALKHAWLGDVPDVGLDPTLSEHARLHASYLEIHPDQAASWPEAHEEFTDREGFTPEGNWSGGHSVIAPGVRSAKEALDGWMGTFYHRLPLLEPGLLRIGWALEGQTCVLDSGSIVREVDFAWEVAWPPADMRDVPRSFVAELPSPFPGEDQSQWGYPITLQLGPRPQTATPEISMSLHDASRDGATVPCLFSSPQHPGNPLLVPTLSWCLIPRQRLRANTDYQVRAVLSGAELGLGGTELSWSFRTGL